MKSTKALNSAAKRLRKAQENFLSVKKKKKQLKNQPKLFAKKFASAETRLAKAKSFMLKLKKTQLKKPKIVKKRKLSALTPKAKTAIIRKIQMSGLRKSLKGKKR